MKYLPRAVCAMALVNQGLSIIANAPEVSSEPWQIWAMVISGASAFLIAGWVIFHGVE